MQKCNSFAEKDNQYVQELLIFLFQQLFCSLALQSMLQNNYPVIVSPLRRCISSLFALFASYLTHGLIVLLNLASLQKNMISSSASCTFQYDTVRQIARLRALTSRTNRVVVSSSSSASPDAQVVHQPYCTQYTSN